MDTIQKSKFATIHIKKLALKCQKIFNVLRIKSRRDENNKSGDVIGFRGSYNTIYLVNETKISNTCNIFFIEIFIRILYYSEKALYLLLRTKGVAIVTQK